MDYYVRCTYLKRCADERAKTREAGHGHEACKGKKGPTSVFGRDHPPSQSFGRDDPARLRGKFKKYNQTIILRILAILAKMGQKTIKNEQKQQILTQGGQKAIKIDQKTYVGL